MRYSAIAPFALAVASVAATPQTASSAPPKPSNIPKLGGAPIPFGPAPTGCNSYEILIARGTSEPGPFGVIVGDPLVVEIKKLLPDARGYAVKYPADVSSNGTNIGAEDVSKRIKAQITACPQQKFALVGYSQGARVVRIGANSLDDAAQEKIVAAAVYGDSGDKRGTVKFPPKVLARSKVNCVPGDPACSDSSDFTPHLQYNAQGATYHKDSARFIVAGFKGEPLPKLTSIPGTPKGASPNKGP